MNEWSKSNWLMTYPTFFFSFKAWSHPWTSKAFRSKHSKVYYQVRIIQISFEIDKNQQWANGLCFKVSINIQAVVYLVGKVKQDWLTFHYLIIRHFTINFYKYFVNYAFPCKEDFDFYFWKIFSIIFFNLSDKFLSKGIILWS